MTTDKSYVRAFRVSHEINLLIWLDEFTQPTSNDLHYSHNSPRPFSLSHFLRIHRSCQAIPYKSFFISYFAVSFHSRFVVSQFVSYLMSLSSFCQFVCHGPVMGWWGWQASLNFWFPHSRCLARQFFHSFTARFWWWCHKFEVRRPVWTAIIWFLFQYHSYLFRLLVLLMEDTLSEYRVCYTTKPLLRSGRNFATKTWNRLLKMQINGTRFKIHLNIHID